MNDFQNVLVVGGASGIGKATVKKLLEDNYKVIVVDLDRERLELIKNEYISRKKNSLSTLPLDITDKSEVTEGLRWITEQFGHLDCIVISAGIHSTYPVEYLPDDVIHKVLDVNLIAHIKLVRDLLPIIRDGGRIIGVSSIAAGLGVPMSSMYSASKAGLEGFYESLSIEVSYRKIKAILIHPGNVNTGFNETGNIYQPTGNQFIDEGYSRVVSNIDSHYGIIPDVVADAIIKAIKTKSPRFCYIVGLNARKAYWAKRLLGRNMAIKLMAKYFGF